MPFNLPKSSDGIPFFGFGTGTDGYYKRNEREPINETLVNTLVHAVAQGFVLIDAAEAYNTYREISKALRIVMMKGVQRSRLFISDKYSFGRPEKPGEAVLTPYQELERSLGKMGIDYVDLYLLHTPFIDKKKSGFTLEEAWKSMEECREEGLAKKIGVSNFDQSEIERVERAGRHRVEVNQIKYHVFLQDQSPGIVEYCKERGITVEGFSPLAPIIKGDISKEPVKELYELWDKLGEKYGKTHTQLALRWVVQSGVIPISTTTKTERLEEWKGVFDFELEKRDFDAMTTIGRKMELW